MLVINSIKNAELSTNTNMKVALPLVLLLKHNTSNEMEMTSIVVNKF